MDINAYSNLAAPRLESVDNQSRSAVRAAEPAASGAPVAPQVRLNTEPVASREELNRAVEHLNDMMQSKARNLSFNIDESIGKPVIRVTDANTGALIRQIPNEETLQVIRGLESMRGLIFNEKS